MWKSYAIFERSWQKAVATHTRSTHVHTNTLHPHTPTHTPTHTYTPHKQWRAREMPIRPDHPRLQTFFVNLSFMDFAHHFGTVTLPHTHTPTHTHHHTQTMARTGDAHKARPPSPSVNLSFMNYARHFGAVLFATLAKL